MKIRAEGGGQVFARGLTDTTKLTVTFLTFAKAPKKKCLKSGTRKTVSALLCQLKLRDSDQDFW
jgi:hypothetical protein